MTRLGAITTGAILLVAGAHHALAMEEVTTKRSPHAFATTLERVENAAKEKGLMVFARLDHAAAAQSVGQAMPPSTVLVVGNPRSGTQLFQRAPTLAIDLPLKILVWQDANGTVSVAYNSADHLLMLFKRHGLPDNDMIKEQTQRTEALMSDIAAMATR
jgi:uncharacterized protein (DUF302 family)